MAFKHDAVVRAWLDGKTVQYLTASGWENFITHPSNAGIVPAFSTSAHYRIKPEPVTLTYRKLWYKTSKGNLAMELVSLGVLGTKETIERDMLKWGAFVKWEGDWIEEQYEVPDEASSPKG